MSLYRHLDPDRREIRLLHFVSTPNDHPFRLQLTTWSLNEAPSYDALSYVWGDRTPTYPITVNDGSFEVGGSLHLALTQLSRATTTGTWLWIDAICIDQNNVDEKSSQVRQMRGIYQAADSVWISLGNSSQDVDCLLDLIRSIGPKALEAGILELWAVFDQVISGTGLEKHPGLLFLLEMLKYGDLRAATTRCAVMDLLSRPNWARAWVLQEITLATRGNILCGDKTIDLDEFHAVLTAIYFAKIGYFPRQDPGWREFGQELDNNYFHIHSLLARAKRSCGGSVSLLDLLITHRRAVKERPFHAASDPRDIIYALMGVASDTRALGISPDYRKSVPEVYAETTKAMMVHYPQYKLEYCSFPKDIPGLPSWVPDWQRIGRVGVFPHYLSYGDYFKASGGRTQPIIAPISTLVLRPRGILADSVLDIFTIGGKNSQQNTQPGSMMLADTLKSKSSRALCVESILTFAGPFLRAQTSEANLWRLMLAGHMGTARRPAEFDALAPQAFRQKAIRADIVSEKQLTYMLEQSYPFPRKLTADEDIQQFVDTFCERIVGMAAAVARGRTLFLTHRGSLGLGPCNVVEGDSVTVLFGTQVPIILRPTGSTYAYIGDSYVDGIMQGESLGEAYQEMDFEIS